MGVLWNKTWKERLDRQDLKKIHARSSLTHVWFGGVRAQGEGIVPNAQTSVEKSLYENSSTRSYANKKRLLHVLSVNTFVITDANCPEF